MQNAKISYLESILLCENIPRGSRRNELKEICTEAELAKSCPLGIKRFAKPK